MELERYKAALEAVLFALAEPADTEKLAAALELDEHTVEKLCGLLQDEYNAPGRGICLLCLEGRWQFATKPAYGSYVKTALDNRRNAPLSQAALEVLSVIAYNQPVTRSFVEQVRGVDSSGVVASLAQKGLIEEAGRLDLPGRPIAFRTTDVFLRSFGLSSLSELPVLHAEQEQPQTQAQEEKQEG